MSASRLSADPSADSALHSDAPPRPGTSSSSDAEQADRRTPNRLLVISIDALSDVDAPFLRTLPHMSRVLDGAWASARSIYPSVTYPNHTAQITGRTVSGHGIHANEKLQPGMRRPDWFHAAEEITCPTLFDLASRAGLSTASVGWPVTGWSPAIDVCVPEIWGVPGTDAIRALMLDSATPSGRPYVERHGHQIEYTSKPHFGRFMTSVAVDIIHEHRPEVMFVHIVEVDTARHATGRFTPEVRDALIQVDGWIGEILAALAEEGLAEDTNIALVSDHGHVEVGRCFRPNNLLLRDGFVRIDGSGEVTGWDAWVHGTGLTAQLHVNPAADAETQQRLLATIQRWEADPEVPVRRFHPAAALRDEYGFDGPFLGVLEGTSGTNFQGDWDGRPVYTRFDEDYTFLLSQHGHLPEQDIQALFAMTGPDIAEGTTVTLCTLPDEAATFAHLLGVEIPDADGSVVHGMLRAHSPH